MIAPFLLFIALVLGLIQGGGLDAIRAPVLWSLDAYAAADMREALRCVTP